MAPSNVLAVMGVTGAGKSSFIKLVSGNSGIKIGHSQESETTSISSYEVCIRGRRFTLVDTPGFDDLHLSDSDVLKMLVEWLTSTYRSGQKLSGILYLHRISDTRMRGSSLANLRMFRQLIGEDFYKNLTLGTTCWSLVTPSVGAERERELESNDTFWRTMINKGARLERIPQGAVQAQNLVYEIASHAPVALQTQRDIVDLGKSLESLAVARTVNYELEELRKRQDAEAKKAAEARAKRALKEEAARRANLERIRARNKRIQEYADKRSRCARITPSGICDRPGCFNRLQRWRVTWHCCSCVSSDNYWHCGPCGADCGNNEHPAMSKIVNPDDDCVIM